MISLDRFKFLLMLRLCHIYDKCILPIKMFLTVIPHPDAVFVYLSIIASQFNSKITGGKMIRPSFAMMRNENDIWFDF